jgi:hypothetical protein
MKTSKSVRASSPVQKITAAAAAATAATGLLAGCVRSPAPSGAAECSQYQYMPNSTVNPDQPDKGSFKVDVVLLDLSSNSPQTAAMIVKDMGRFVRDAVNQGAYLKVDADPGSQAPVQSPPCFDGTQPFLVTRANQVAQQKAQAAAVNALDNTLTGFIKSVKVSGQGSASRLLHEAPEEVNGLRSNAPLPVGSVQVILWSNLLGNSSTSDCLNVNGVPGTAAYASALAKRCFSERQLIPLPGATVDILGVGAGAVNNQQSLLADDLGTALCAEYGRNCHESPA